MTDTPAPASPLVDACNELLRELAVHRLSMRKIVTSSAGSGKQRGRDLSYSNLMYRNIEVHEEPAPKEGDGTRLVFHLKSVRPDWTQTYYDDFRCFAEQFADEGHKLIALEQDGKGGAVNAYAITHAEDSKPLMQAMEGIHTKMKALAEILPQGMKSQYPAVSPASWSKK